MSDETEILLVEDSANDVELTLRALHRYQISSRVLVLRDGAEALGYLLPDGGADFPHRVRLILLDLKLPKVDGHEVIKRIKADCRTRQIPIVVLTSSQEKRDLLESYDLGANSYIVKPADFNGFAQAIADVGLYWILLNRTAGDL